jgi:RecJ-like exonuclease
MGEKIKRTIVRNVVTVKEVEVPDGHEVCPYCKGKAMLSAYDRGVRSLAHSPRLAAKEPCGRCGGKGYVRTLHGGEE